MARFAVTAVGEDRPGIVAAVTGALVEAGGNLEDTTMAILGGHFAMVLLVAGGEVTAAGLRAALAGPAAELGLVVSVGAADVDADAASAGERWVVSVYGADRPGIVHRFAAVLAEAGANIVDLETHVIGDADRTVYAMAIDVTLPPGADGAAISARLTAVGEELGVHCSAHPADADVL